MKRHRRPHEKKSTARPSLLERMSPNAAGVDCGSEAHDVAVPPDRDAAPVRSFMTFTTELHRLADWLTACGVTTVAMESTGVYWIPLYEILEARGLDVVLVNARHVKNVPGRKTDVLDCQWIRSRSCMAWGCCAAASDRPLRSRPCAPICATARPWCRAPPRTPSVCRRRWSR